jgi:hypothetical protein
MVGFTRRSSGSSSAPADAARNKVAGYLNIGIMTKQGLKRLGGQGIGLRESHPLEGMIIELLKDCQSEADVEAQLKALAGRIVLSYGEATPEGQKFELA